MQNVDRDACCPNSLNTREMPLSCGDPKDLQECRSIGTTQPCKISSHWPEDGYPAKWDPGPILYPNEALVQGMDPCQVQSGDPSNRLPLPFEATYIPNGYTRPLLQGIHVPSSSHTVSDVYEGGSGQAAQVPLLSLPLESRRPSHQVSSRDDLRFNRPRDSIYRPERAVPYPQARRLDAGSSWESEIGRQPPPTNVAQQFIRPSHLLSHGDAISAYTSAQGPIRGTFAGSEFGCASGDGIYGQVYDTASPKETSHLRVARDQMPAFVVRARIAPGRNHYPYQDEELRRKYPKERQHALELAIEFQKEHGRTKGIPPDLLDKLLEKRVDDNLLENKADDKYYCFCCPDNRKSRTITPARDHVRKSLGNFPFRCLNPWCHHSSLRQADLNKHMRICTKRASSAPKSSTSGMHNPEVTGSMMQDQGSVYPQSMFNVTDSRPDHGNTHTGPPSAAGFRTQNYQV